MSYTMLWLDNLNLLNYILQKFLKNAWTTWLEDKLKFSVLFLLGFIVLA